MNNLKNSKSQIPNHKQIIIPKLQNSKQFRSLDIDIWNFIGIWCLEFEIYQHVNTPWNFSQNCLSIGNGFKNQLIRYTMVP